MGGPGPSDRKALFSHQLILQKRSMVFQRKKNTFPRFRGGPPFSRGWGPTFSRGGPIAYSLIETHITCDFREGWGLDLLSPFWIRACIKQIQEFII